MKISFCNTIIECQQGNIVNQPDCKAIVNAANKWLKPGGGVAGAIHRAAGPELEKEAEKYAPISVGQAVITKAYNLPNDFVIHCLGPVYGVDEPSSTLLSKCYENALKLAQKHKIASIAFPSISTGIFGYPKYDAAIVAFTTLKNVLPDCPDIKLIRFVLFDYQSWSIHKKALQEIF